MKTNRSRRQSKLLNIRVWAEDAVYEYCVADRVLPDGTNAKFNFVRPVNRPPSKPLPPNG
jgi:hypothetical protein